MNIIINSVAKKVSETTVRNLLQFVISKEFQAISKVSYAL